LKVVIKILEYYAVTQLNRVRWAWANYLSSSIEFAVVAVPKIVKLDCQ